jgi:hypothetical protein
VLVLVFALGIVVGLLISVAAALAVGAVLHRSGHARVARDVRDLEAFRRLDISLARAASPSKARPPGL